MSLDFEKFMLMIFLRGFEGSRTVGLVHLGCGNYRRREDICSCVLGSASQYHNRRRNGVKMGDHGFTKFYCWLLALDESCDKSMISSCKNETPTAIHTAYFIVILLFLL
jgi:hypothetical protein